VWPHNSRDCLLYWFQASEISVQPWCRWIQTLGK